MRTTKALRRSIVAVSILLSAVATPLPASAATAAKDHCLIQVIGTDENNNFITEPMRCFGTFAEVLRAQNVPNQKADVSPSTVDMSVVLATTATIGIHYDGINGSGASLSVSGSDCLGGGLNVPLSFNDKTSSTLNGCPTIRHYEHTNYAGATFNTAGVGQVDNVTGYMDNRTSSIRYLN